jgi:hypothetical protein
VLQSADIQVRLVTALRDAAAELRSAVLSREMLTRARLPDDLATEMERLATQVREQCVVAVVGQVKAGKSTFINALLGEDLAKVGTTETTATINYFRYGPLDPERPVICYRRDGPATPETRAFLDSLQGNDVETLRRAADIDHLEYHLLNPILEQMTLVDTPGTRAAVQEHVQRTAEFMRLEEELQDRHDAETRRLQGDADAVIYLVGAAAHIADREFLAQFQHGLGDDPRTLNSLGVLAKVDLDADMLDRRHELAEKIAVQLQSSISTVVPVSAGLRRALDRMSGSDVLERLAVLMRSLPPARQERVLLAEELFLDPDLEGPLTVEEREELLGDIPWTVFTLIARQLGDSTLPTAEATAQLNELAGFDELMRVLRRQFFQRGGYLRAFRVLQDARALVSRLKFRYAPLHRQWQREERALVQRRLDFLQAAPGDPEIRAEIEELVRTQAPAESDIGAIVASLEIGLGSIAAELEAYRADLDALLLLADEPDAFTAEELQELRALLGLHGIEPERRVPEGMLTAEHIRTRQMFWRVHVGSARVARREVAERAEARYGYLLDEIGP